MRDSRICRRTRDRHAFRRAFGIAVATACCAGSLWGVDPYRTTSQYVRDRWGSEQGFPQGPVYSIAQTSDGYLWIGTEKGLVRFDGISFQQMQSATPTQSSLSHVLGVVADAGTGLWLRLRRPGLTLLRYQGGVFQNVMGDLATDASVSAMARGRDGRMLFCLLEGMESKIVIRGQDFEKLASPAGLSRSAVLAIAQTTGGELWLGTGDAGLFRIRNGQAVAVREGLADLKVNALAPAGNGDLWVGTDGGLMRWDGTTLTKDRVPHELEGVQVLATLVDRNSNLWIGTNTRGLMRVNEGGAFWMDRPSPQGKAVTALFEDREGNLWFGTESGIERIRDSVFVSYSSAEGALPDHVGPIHVDQDDRTWFAPISGGLSWLREGELEAVKLAGLDRDIVYSIAGDGDGLWIGRQKGGLTHLRRQGRTFSARIYTKKDGLAEDSVYAVTRSRDGAIWAGTLSGGVSKLQDGRFRTYTRADGLPSNTVFSILEGAGGLMWFGTPDGLSVLANGRWHTYTSADGLPSKEVICLLEDQLGVLWIGTSNGLALRRAGRIVTPNAAPPSLREPILGIAEDGSGSLWLATATHVVRVRREKLLSGSFSPGDVREYGTADGLRGAEGVRRNRSVVKDRRGRIWFSTNRGISVVLPELLSVSSAPAIAHIQSISADDDDIEMKERIRIPPRTQRLTLRFAGLSLAVPERVRFRYRLDGFDHAWSQPTATREAVYTNLGPGSYTFRVIASNADGVWNSSERSLSFSVDPAFWQTWWFQLCGVLSGILGSVALYRFRVKQVTQQLSVRFEERLAERTRIAHELHDTLLQGFLSASMQLHVTADQLSEDSSAKPAIDRVLHLMGRVIEEGRNAVRGLRASDSSAVDLAGEFALIPKELGTEVDCDFRVIVAGEAQPLHPVLRHDVYRIGREALVNAFRHSRAKTVELELEYTAKRFRIQIRDNGCGIDASVLGSGRDGHWGLAGMRERADLIGAEFHVRSSAATGTEVELTVPASLAFSVHSRNGMLQRFGRRLTRKTRARTLTN